MARLDYVELPGTDMAATRRFYEQAFGWAMTQFAPTYAATNPKPGRLVPPPLSSDAVARQALAALGRSPVVVPGVRTRLAMLAATRLLPRRAAVALSSEQTARMYRLLSP